MKWTFLSLIYTFLFSSSVLACDCAGSPFLESARNSTILISGKIGEFSDYRMWSNGQQAPSTMKFLVKKVLKGSIQPNTVLNVRGDTGAECLVRLTNFKKNETAIFVLDKTKGDDYTLSSCGWNYVKIEGQKVKGFINRDFRASGGKEEIINLTELIKQISTSKK